jgi:hypothetical protein
MMQEASWPFKWRLARASIARPAVPRQDIDLDQKATSFAPNPSVSSPSCMTEGALEDVFGDGATGSNRKPPAG